MNNDSSTGGYLTPTSSVAPHDDAFIQFFQEVIVGITGLAGAMVRPRWQPTPPQWPQLTTDWASIGVISETDLNLRGSVQHHPDGEGYDVLERTVRDTILISFYGPNGWEKAGLLSDGLTIEQNRYALHSACVGIINISSRRNIPELINEQWLQRIDLEIVVNRTIQRVYPILNLLSAVGTIRANPPGSSTTINTGFDTDQPDDYYGA